EFIMKDAYSFHADVDSLEQTYRLMQETYSRIFTRIGLKFRAVAADTGAIGGSGSHEFHVLADSGEDAIAFCPASDYAANIELAEAVPHGIPRKEPAGIMAKIATPDRKSCQDVADFLGIPVEQTLKALAVTAGGKFYLLLLRGDHQLNETKVRKIPFLGDFEFAEESRIIAEMSCPPGYLGPVGVKAEIIADRAVLEMSDFTCGANEEGFHLSHVNFGRDLPLPDQVFDIRNIVAGDPSPDGKGVLEICRGIEVGHVFQLRTKYSEKMKATYLDESGQTRIMEMGCYGIGVSRIVAAAIEQNYDERGIIFPQTIAPFQLSIIPVGYHKSQQVRTEAEKLYQACRSAGIEVLLDDREERPGVMFADQELIGIPHRIVIGERNLREGMVEYQGRLDKTPQMLSLSEAASIISKICGD
ncbi:MAG: proline--tRNA ligase, partial [Nitrosomonas sp.]|nr:proline--tRNA ligase [Nitrosomonas sp.]